jgi:hypothetical protein
MIAKFVPLLLVLFVASCSWSASADRSGGGGGNGTQTTQFRSGDELRAYRRILARMDRLKKASVKTIQASFSILPATVFCGGALAISACICVRLAIIADFFGLHAEPRRRRHPLRAGAPAAGVRPPEDERTEARGT